MKQDQKFTPKYWVLHDKTTDDVFTDSMRKSRADVCSYAEKLLAEDWFMDDNLEIILVEIKKAEEN